MIKAKIVALNPEELLINNDLVHSLIKEAETLLKDRYMVTFIIPQIQLEGFFSLTFVLDRCGKSINESFVQLKCFNKRLRELRLDLVQIEKTYIEGNNLRKPLDYLMDMLELPKEYYWLEKNFPGPAFREGLYRFYESEKDVLASAIGRIRSINWGINEEAFKHFQIDSLGPLENLLRGLRVFVERTERQFTESFWDTFEYKSCLIAGMQISESAYFETLHKRSSIVWTFELFEKSGSNNLDPGKVRSEISDTILPELEHLWFQFGKLKLTQFDSPPDFNYMATLPEVDKTRDIDKPFQPRKLQKLGEYS